MCRRKARMSFAVLLNCILPCCVRFELEGDCYSISADARWATALLWVTNAEEPLSYTLRAWRVLTQWPASGVCCGLALGTHQRVLVLHHEDSETTISGQTSWDQRVLQHRELLVAAGWMCLATDRPVRLQHILICMNPCVEKVPSSHHFKSSSW